MAVRATWTRHIRGGDPTVPPTLPPSLDLVIEDLTAPQSLEAGTPVSIGFTIRNVGTAPSGAFAYSYDVGGGGGSTTVPSLLPGLLYAAYEDLGDAEYANEVAESDEANNEASRQVQVDCGVKCREGLIRGASRRSA